MGLQSLVHKDDSITWPEIYRLVFWPIESVRYFEFGAAWDFVANVPARTYLDISSPRLFPIVLAKGRKDLQVEIINPDAKDLSITAGLLKACELRERCRISNCLIEDVPYTPASFDVITSLSVVEHIPDDQAAVRKIWGLLKPGGCLILSVPCAAAAEEHYLNVDYYGLQQPNADGFYFLQYVYDQALLEQRFYPVTGRPARSAIYGERQPGSLVRGLVQKWSCAKYPYWREPYTMACEFQRYQTLADLPGDGVIIMQFLKP